MAKGTHRLWILPAPTKPLSPAAARRWLRRVYPRLSALVAMAHHPHAITPPRKREEIRIGLTLLDGDLRRMVNACAEAIDTKRPVTIGYHHALMPQNALRKIRGVRRFAAARDYKVDTLLAGIESALARRVKAARPIYRAMMVLSRGVPKAAAA